MILLDSTAIVGFLDADDALHGVVVAKFRDIVGSQPFAASVVSYAEVMTGAALGHHSTELVEGFFETFVSEIFPVDLPVASRAAALLGVLTSLRMPDALILATADVHSEVDTVICCDKDWTKIRLRCRVERLQPATAPAKGATPPPRPA